LFKTEPTFWIRNSVEFSNDYSFKCPLGMLFRVFAALYATKMFFFLVGHDLLTIGLGPGVL